MANLMEGLLSELTRNRELLEIFKTIPTGVFGAMSIQRDIDAAEKAISAGDVIAILAVYKTLKNNKA